MKRSANFFGLNPFERHKILINEYLLTNPDAFKLLQRDRTKDKRDIDVIRENHRFLWSDEEGEGSTWGEKLAKKYYDKLFKEYCICDLTRYKENKVALRWRVEQEVVVGKGQFECGNKECKERDQLTSWEVNFAYKEHGEKKNALVKLRLCSACSKKLNYHHKKKEARPRVDLRQETEDGSAPKRRKTDEDVEVHEKVNSKENSESSKVVDESKVWKEAGAPVQGKSRDVEFQEYFDDLFM
ncbi:Hypothetical predicted protein [Cloeon dipterum]|uniref:Uncharacterized protein n=1 Tax=Cloeon dipterum TaxID=197152 RepID=A0A8S1BUI7_9INSE|nr:Hypothetical predicted protein [Cloeon dipterum]